MNIVDKLSHLKKFDGGVFREVIAENGYEVTYKDISGRTVIDIGANYGMFSCLVAELGAKQVVAVEPISTTFDDMEQVCSSYQNIYPIKKAVTSKDADALKIYLFDNKGIVSAFKESDSFETVKTISLQTLVDDADDTNIYLKIDCEGGEYDIILNSPDSAFDKITDIAMEVHYEMHPKYKGIAKLHRRLESLGFKMVREKQLYWWNENEHGQRVSELETTPYKFERWTKNLENYRVLCSISTRGRTNTTLPLALKSVINQTVKPNKLVIFDDNDEKIDLRTLPEYQEIFDTCNKHQIEWEVNFGECKGQHFNHQKANMMGYQWVWRVDDDCMPKPDVLEKLLRHTEQYPDTGAVGGFIYTPVGNLDPALKAVASNTFQGFLERKLNQQWFLIDKVEEVDHLHCSFLYRAGVTNYNLSLSKVAHLEETLFTLQLKECGYKNYIIPDADTFHMKQDSGGIRSHNDPEMYKHDEFVFNKMLEYGFLVVLDAGLGDHIVFESLLDDLLKKHKKVTIACCYPEVFEDYTNKTKVKLISIAEVARVVVLDEYNIYKNMIDWGWIDSLKDAYRKLYKI